MVNKLCFILVMSIILLLTSCVAPGANVITEADRKNAQIFLKERTSEKPAPKLKPDGSKYRIAYVDIDPYPLTGEMLYYLVLELRETGWIQFGELPFDPKNTDAKELINYLAEESGEGSYIEFSKEANYYLALDGEDFCAESLLNHAENNNIDLIFCMGTWPGLFVKNLGITDIPVMLYTSIDPVGSGFSVSEADSGQDNLWAHINYSVFKKQLQFYYDNFKFDNIGIIYYDEKIAAMPAYREVAAANGFIISEYSMDKYKNDTPEDIDIYYDSLKAACYELAQNKGIDAFMISTDIFKDLDRLDEFMQIFYDRKIPCFVQNGEYFVENGALMIITASDAAQQASFISDITANILYGVKPRSLPQEYITSPYLAVNLDAAAKIGYNPPPEMLFSAERIYGRGLEDE